MMSGEISTASHRACYGGFPVAISGDHKLTSDAFYEVWYEINYENILRRQNNPRHNAAGDRLHCDLHPLNHQLRQPRVVSKKTDIRVLALQPGNGEYPCQ